MARGVVAQSPVLEELTKKVGGIVDVCFLPTESSCGPLDSPQPIRFATVMSKELERRERNKSVRQRRIIGRALIVALATVATLSWAGMLMLR